MAHDPTDFSHRTVTELILGGDYASALCNDETLAVVAREVAARARPEERYVLERVASLCAVDMSAATALWLVATAPLRDRCHQPGPRHGDPPP